jgi:CDP-glycerol glycerophosphotransferase
MQELYADKFGVTSKTVPTGYGRVDKLINGAYSNVKEKYSIPTDKKIIMIAPTWKHNDPDRSLLPFGMNQNELVAYLENLAKDTNTFIIFRAHMLSGNPLDPEQANNVRAMPSNDYPDTEELLSVVDILVTDWSSLAFDFMVVDRPVIFIDTRPPFRTEEIALRANPSGRFGEIVKQQEEFDFAIRTYLREPDLYLRNHATQIAQIKEDAYGDTADGKATQRYYEHLKALLEG